MNTFYVFWHPALGYDAVKEGGSWPALLFGPLWAMAKRMWSLSFSILFSILIISGVEYVFDKFEMQVMANIFFFLRFAYFILVGIEGNKWRREYLIEHGYDEIETVEAANKDSAIAIVMNQ